MFCPKCMTTRVAIVNAKCSDMCSVEVEDNSTQGYVPTDMNIGGGDYIYFKYCLKCGHIISDKWPLPDTAIEQLSNKGEDEDE